MRGIDMTKFPIDLGEDVDKIWEEMNQPGHNRTRYNILAIVEAHQKHWMRRNKQMNWLAGIIGFSLCGFLVTSWRLYSILTSGGGG
jgi:hypothetical protein